MLREMVLCANDVVWNGFFGSRLQGMSCANVTLRSDAGIRRDEMRFVKLEQDHEGVTLRNLADTMP